MIPPGVEVGQVLVVETEKMQDGGVEIMNVGPFGGDTEAELVSRTEHGAALDQSPSISDMKSR